MSTKNKQKHELEYISLSEASRESGYTPEYLNSLARKGKLKAQKIGRNWHTTPAWLNDFIASTKNAKKERIDKISSSIEGYTNGKAGDQIEEKSIEQQAVGFSGKSEEQSKMESVSEGPVPDKAEKKFQSRWRSANTFSTALMVVFLTFAIFQAGRFLRFESSNDTEIASTFPAQFPSATGNKNSISGDEGIVKGDTTANADVGTQTGPTLMSENFHIKEVKFSGAIAMASAQENPDFEIYDIRSEVITTKGKEDSKILVYWKTTKLALASIEYSTMSGGNSHALSEDSYGFNHSVVLAGLDPGTAYAYVIKSKDRWGNEISSDRYAAYTGSKIVSVFDMIVNAIKETFSWAIKK